MFTKVLVANRGAIALRIIKTLQKMQIQSVAVYAEDDLESLHVAAADEAYSLGEGPVSATYLNQDRLFEIAQRCGAQAIHPGYGFLSENQEFATRCQNKGVKFIGPDARHMQAFSLKHEARALAQKHQVPLLPGSDLVSDLEQARQRAKHIGYPLMLKASAGGGGIGMKVCYSEQELEHVFDSVRRLSSNNFANDGVFLEKFIEKARHIEIQVFGDGNGSVLAFCERDCSTQRRNQKVIEESPAPNLDQATRAQLRQHAVNLLSAVRYENAGTVEFVLDQNSGEFYFLEVNTRLQVEHAVTESLYRIDLVEWMIRQAAGEMEALSELDSRLQASGHSIQVRLYAEDPAKNFQPSSGIISSVEFPQLEGLRIDTWISNGVEVSAKYDPMLAKIIVHEQDRDGAIKKLTQALAQTRLYGFESNLQYMSTIIGSDEFRQGRVTTRFLQAYHYQPATVDVISPGTMTTFQDYPGRVGYWDVGVPPSGPFDDYSFRLANAMLGNPSDAVGLEITLSGPSLRFNQAARIVLSGAIFHAAVNGKEIPFYQIIEINPGDVLKIGSVIDAGSRCYLCLQGGFDCAQYLGSCATFTLGEFGGHVGRSLRSGDVLRMKRAASVAKSHARIDQRIKANISHHWRLHVSYGPHGAPDFFTEPDMQAFFNAHWQVHYNSSRTGIRLVGPKPEWARSDGGEAGMHPSNIHDNAYAIGSVDFTGDMPVILGPDGPSLGGFVCPVTVVTAERWKLGQLKAGDTVEFIAIGYQQALQLKQQMDSQIQHLKYHALEPLTLSRESPRVYYSEAEQSFPALLCRMAGDDYLLVEFGEQELDIALRFWVHEFMLNLKGKRLSGVLELTPGIRSLQIHYDPSLCDLQRLLSHIEQSIDEIKAQPSHAVESRIVHLPLSWDDRACHLAIEKYMKSVRKDAPWCPSNLEFIRRINGLQSIAEVKRIVFDASYLVMGLGDVYLGAPVATPVNPAHRLVTTKYNPARTWTAENSVGIGGAYLCIYGMEGPGGYQFVGRTLQMWNRYRKTAAFTQPWLLRFFDQIRFFEVSYAELRQIRRDFVLGRYPLRIEQTRFSLQEYQSLLQQQAPDIDAFTQTRRRAFDEELARWRSSGAINFEVTQDQVAASELEHELPEHHHSVDSPVAGSVWQVLVKPGQTVAAGQSLMILESMKMEIEIHAVEDGTVQRICKPEGQQVYAGEALVILGPVQ